MSISKYLSFIRLNANALAEQANTEKSNTPLIPVEKVIDNAKIKSSHPLNLANSSVLNPRIKHIAKITSAKVTTPPTYGIKESGNQGLITCV